MTVIILIHLRYVHLSSLFLSVIFLPALWQIGQDQWRKSHIAYVQYILHNRMKDIQICLYRFAISKKSMAPRCGKIQNSEKNRKCVMLNGIIATKGNCCCAIVCTLDTHFGCIAACSPRISPSFSGSFKVVSTAGSEHEIFRHSPAVLFRNITKIDIVTYCRESDNTCVLDKHIMEVTADFFEEVL